MSSRSLGTRTTRTEARRLSKCVLCVPVRKANHGETMLTAHQPLRVKLDRDSKLVASVGCMDCWYTLWGGVHNMLQFVLQGREPGQRLLRNWTKRTRTFGKQNFGESKLDNLTVWNQWSASGTSQRTVDWAERDIITHGAVKRTVLYNAARDDWYWWTHVDRGASNVSDWTQERRTDEERLRLRQTRSYLKWSKNPPRTRALCSRNLAQYLKHFEIARVKYESQVVWPPARTKSKHKLELFVWWCRHGAQRTERRVEADSKSSGGRVGHAETTGWSVSAACKAPASCPCTHRKEVVE